MTIAFRPLRNPNPLGFPGGVLPGVDWSHPAARGVVSGHGFSGTALGSGLVNLLGGKLGAIGSGGPTLSLNGSIGPCATFGTTDDYTYSGQSTANDSTGTFAAILVVNAQVGTQAIFRNSNATTGVEFRISTTGLSIAGPGGSLAAGASLGSVSTGVPYFGAFSFTGTSALAALLLRMDTGVIKTATGAPTGSPVAPNGTYRIGLNSQSSIAAVMFSTSFLQLPQLLAWAADPWAFWYPRRDTVLVGAAAAAFQAYWAQQNNMPVIGAGTY